MYEQGKYQFNSDQLKILQEFLADTKIYNDKFIKLRIDLSYFEDDYKQLHLIGDQMENHKFLKQLDIDLECYENESNEKESEPTTIFSKFSTLKNLRSISLNFDGARFTDNHLWELAKQIQFLFRLEELFFNFNETAIEGDQGLCMLFEGLSEMAQLKKFHLTMDFTKITDNGFNHIAKSLTNKKELAELVLSFNKTNIKNNDGLKLLNSALLICLDLTRFELNLCKTGIN